MESPEQKINTVNAEKSPKLRHLKEGVQGIIVCVGTQDQFKESSGPEKEVFFDMPIPYHVSAHDVDYFGDPHDLQTRGFKNAGLKSYVISPIDNFDKFSREFKDCTGLIVTGQDKETGQNISFVSHQDPEYFLKLEVNKNNFRINLSEQLAKLKERSVEGTVDAVIIGGNYIKHIEEYKRLYLESIKLLAGETLKVLGFEPIVATGPKTNSGGDHIFYDNKNRRLFIVRSEVGDGSTQSFAPSAIESQEKKW